MTSTAMTNQELTRRVDELLSNLGYGPVVGWDLDSTVRDTSHRRYVARAIRDHKGEWTWDDYSMMCSDDQPIEGSVVLMRELKMCGYSHVAVSGSSEKARNLTVGWALEHRVPFDGYMLRADGDRTANGVWKVRVLRELQRQGADVRLFFEDWGKVAEQVRQETGIPVVGINPFDCEELACLGRTG